MMWLMLFGHSCQQQHGACQPVWDPRLAHVLFPEACLDGFEIRTALLFSEPMENRKLASMLLSDFLLL
jgi:hypothetical protein